MRVFKASPLPDRLTERLGIICHIRAAIYARNSRGKCKSLDDGTSRRKAGLGQSMQGVPELRQLKSRSPRPVNRPIGNGLERR
jgi:hypothetical protein